MNKLFRLFLAKILIIFSGFLISVSFAQSNKVVNGIKANAFIDSNFAEVYQGPNGGTPLAIISRFTPIETISVAGSYSKIRDVWGNFGWVKTANINNKEKYVLAKGPVTPVLADAKNSSNIVFEVTSSVALKVLGVSGEWLHVEHFDKQKGFVAMVNVIGYK